MAALSSHCTRGPHLAGERGELHGLDHGHDCRGKRRQHGGGAGDGGERHHGGLHRPRQALEQPEPGVEVAHEPVERRQERRPHGDLELLQRVVELVRGACRRIAVGLRGAGELLVDGGERLRGGRALGKDDAVALERRGVALGDLAHEQRRFVEVHVPAARQVGRQRQEVEPLGRRARDLGQRRERALEGALRVGRELRLRRHHLVHLRLVGAPRDLRVGQRAVERREVGAVLLLGSRQRELRLLHGHRGGAVLERRLAVLVGGVRRGGGRLGERHLGGGYRDGAFARSGQRRGVARLGVVGGQHRGLELRETELVRRARRRPNS